MEADDPLGIAGERAGPFRIQGLIGRGAFSLVYRALRIRGGDAVALKIVDPRAAARPEVMRRFRREGAIALRLHHPHIAEAVGSGTIRGLPFIAFAFIEGESLAERLARGRLEEGEALDVGIALAEALDYVHTRAGLVHRDVKPSNIRIGPGGEVYLTDFGIACRTGQRRPDEAQGSGEGFAGTWAYAAPEQYRGEPADGRADVFALGLVLCQMCTGRLPERRRDGGVLLPFAAAESEEGASAPALSRGLADAILWFTEPERERRCPSARAAAQELRGLRTGAPMVRRLAERPTQVLPRPPAALQARRGRRAARACVAAVAVGLLGFAAMVGTPLGRRDVREVTLPAVDDYGAALIGDLSGRGEEELLVPRGRDVLVCDGQGRVKWLLPFDRIVSLCLLADIHGDGEPELFAAGKQGTEDGYRVVLLAANRPGYLAATYEVRGLRDSSIAAAGVGDLEGDGRAEVVACVRTGNLDGGTQPRGVWVFDAPRGKPKWSFQVGPFVEDRSLRLADLDGDGRLEIVFGTYAPDNGSEGPDGSDDAHCYVYALDAAGKLRFRLALGGPYQGADVATGDLDGDGEGRPEIVAALHTDRRSEGLPTLGGLAVVDASGRLRGLAARGRSCRGVVLLGGSDGRSVAYTVTDDGALYRVRITGAGQIAAKSFRVPGAPERGARLRLAAAEDLDRDGRTEFVLLGYRLWGPQPASAGELWRIRDVRVRPVTPDGRVLLDRCILKESPERTFRVRCADLDGDGHLEIVVLGPRIYVVR